jgi:hypothetical protein
VQAEPVQASASIPAVLLKNVAFVADVVSPAGNKHKNRKWHKWELVQLTLQAIYRGRDYPEKPHQEKLTKEVIKRLLKDYPDYANTTAVKYKLSKGKPLLSRREVMRVLRFLRKRDCRTR